jgi:hypothetical protein
MSLLEDIKGAAHAVARIVDAAIPDPGDWIQRGSAALGVPELLGDAAAAVFNVATGNYGGALLNAVEVLTDDASEIARGAAGQGAGVASPGTAPPPPTPLAPSTLRAAMVEDAATMGHADDSLAMIGPRPDRSKPLARPASTATAARPSATAAANTSSPAPAAAAPPNSTASKPTASKPTTTPANKPPAQAPAKPARPDAELSRFFAGTDADLMRAMSENKIPQGVLDDPGQMLLLQQRLHHAQELFTLMSTMARTLHEMRMGMINNCRA